jgi:hypothetical protein
MYMSQWWAPHMVSMALIPLCDHHFLPHECHKPSKTTFGLNWVQATLSCKYMTNIRQNGGLESMQEKWWQETIPLGNKTLLIWITNTKRLGIYTKILPFPFTHGHLIIRMMCFIFKMWMRLMGFISHHKKINLVLFYYPNSLGF